MLRLGPKKPRSGRTRVLALHPQDDNEDAERVPDAQHTDSDLDLLHRDGLHSLETAKSEIFPAAVSEENAQVRRLDNGRRLFPVR